MSARRLIMGLFGIALVLICAFTLITFQIVWDLLGNVLPSTLGVGDVIFPTSWVVYFGAALLYILIALIFVFLYLFLDRAVLRPVKIVGAAMQDFAAHSTLSPLPPTDRSIAEVASFVDAFKEYTDSVERVHERDMQVSRMKSDFISTAAHQLRTPMTGIRWALEALQMSQLTDDQKALVDSAVGKSHDLVAIIGTLLDISAIESGKYKYKFEATDMDALAEEMARDFSPMAQTRQVSLYYAKGETPIPNAKADRERVKWVLNNLIENALRYTPTGGSVQLTLESGMGRVFFKVKDTGIGIPESDRANIFERFYRAPNAVQKENAGNGLGLYIARTIATDHGGDLNFEPNASGPGTTFTLSLPIAA